LTEGAISAPGYSVSPYNRIQTSEFSWAPDGGSIAFVSKRNGFSNIWLVSVEGGSGSELMISKNADENTLFYSPVWSADGSKLAYCSKIRGPAADEATKNVFSVIDVNTREEKQVAVLNSLTRLIGWTELDKGFVIAEASKFAGLPPEVDLVEVNVETGKIKDIAKLKDTYYYNISLSHDKRSIAYVAHMEGIDNVWTISSGGGNAKKLSSNNDPNRYYSSLSWSPDSGGIYFGKQTRYSLLSMLTNFQ
jgi:Tol biopolymer transport system component